MLNKIDIGWNVIYNDHNGDKCPAIVTKVYDSNDPNTDLDLHVIGIKGNSSYSRGKIQVPYGVNTNSSWEYNDQRTVTIDENDLPNDGELLVYNPATDSFETEDITAALLCVDGGAF